MIVYVITNVLNGKQYVGQTVCGLSMRWKRHCWLSTSRSDMPISLAIQKYGKEVFRILELEKCSSQKELDKRELFWAKKLNTFSPAGYNLRAGNGAGAMSAETKRKMAEAKIGKVFSDEHRKRLSDSHKGFRVSNATKRKLSALNRGKRGTDFCYQRSVEATAKTYYLINPSGKPVRIVNMRRYCLMHGYSAARMCELVRGKRKAYRGWSVRPLRMQCLQRQGMEEHAGQDADEKARASGT